MPDLTYEELLAAIAPRSDQLNSDDLVTGPITVKILDVCKGSDAKMPYHLDVEGYPGRPWKPCKTMLRVLAHVWSEEAGEKVSPSRWIGRTVTLYRDGEVIYGGHVVGGIRISHMSDIAKPYDLTVTITRGKRKQITIHPVQAFTPEEQKFIDGARLELETAPDMDALKTYGRILKDHPQAVRDVLRPVAAKRKEELTKGE